LQLLQVNETTAVGVDMEMSGSWNFLSLVTLWLLLGNGRSLSEWCFRTCSTCGHWTLCNFDNMISRFLRIVNSGWKISLEMLTGSLLRLVILTILILLILNPPRS